MTKGDVVSLISTDVRVHQDIVKYVLMDDNMWGGRYIDFDSGWNNFGENVFYYFYIIFFYIFSSSDSSSDSSVDSNIQRNLASCPI